MRKYLLAAVAITALSSPAMARDGSAYVGIEGGIMFPRDMDGNGLVDFTSTPATPAGPVDFVGLGDFDAELKRGYDIDAVAGYDFGAFRLELEGGYKRAKRDGFDPSATFLTQLNAGLNRPSAAPAPGGARLLARTSARGELVRCGTAQRSPGLRSRGFLRQCSVAAPLARWRPAR